MQMWNPPQKAEGVRKWAKYLAPVGHSSGISVPKSWANFCTLTLLDPERFEWAKAFLGSKAWSLVINNNASEASLTFSLPSKCPLKEKLVLGSCRGGGGGVWSLISTMLLT
jgi:hypothetical protein